MHFAGENGEVIALVDEAQAKAQLAEVKRINPAFKPAALASLLPYRNSAGIDLVTRGLEKAGLLSGS